jgi:hypothetical protein
LKKSHHRKLLKKIKHYESEILDLLNHMNMKEKLRRKTLNKSKQGCLLKTCDDAADAENEFAYVDYAYPYDDYEHPYENDEQKNDPPSRLIN